MDSCLVQIKQIVYSTSKKNGKQNQSEINDILTMTGITGKIIYIKSLIENVLSDGVGRESFKLQTLRDEINALTQSSQAVLFKKELSAMKLSTTQIKSFRVTPSGEYLFGILPNQPTSLTSALLFDYLCEHPKERIDRTNCSNANIFS
ncbi:CCR4-not transcription complex, putative, partial [Entamoeba histolytica HM-3:IMSS]